MNKKLNANADGRGGSRTARDISQTARNNSGGSRTAPTPTDGKNNDNDED